MQHATQILFVCRKEARWAVPRERSHKVMVAAAAHLKSLKALKSHLLCFSICWRVVPTAWYLEPDSTSVLLIPTMSGRWGQQQGRSRRVMRSVTTYTLENQRCGERWPESYNRSAHNNSYDRNQKNNNKYKRSKVSSVSRESKGKTDELAVLTNAGEVISSTVWSFCPASMSWRMLPNLTPLCLFHKAALGKVEA